MSMNDFEIIQKLGSGSFSTVFKVKRRSDGQIYALKQVKMGMLSSKEKESALNEIRILGFFLYYYKHKLASINNPHIVQFKDCFLDQKTNYLCIVLEFCEGGDIANQIKEHVKKRTYFKEELIWEYLIQLLKGLNTLHQLTILHRDIKSANIFLSKSKCKLGDLNVSKVSKNNLAQTQTGTPYYAAPEIWKDKKYDGKCDIWSLGCVLYEIAALQPPFRAHGLKELNSKIQTGKYSALPKIYSSDLADIIGQCLKVRPQLRPTTDELLNNPIIQQHDKKGQISQGQNVKLSKEQLLATIKLPRNLGALKEKLPKPKYQENLNSSFEKKRDLEINVEPSQKIPDFVYKERISSAHPNRKIDIYNNIQKDELKQQKIQIEKEQEDLKKKLENKKKDNNLIQKQNQLITDSKGQQKKEEKKIQQNQEINQPQNQLIADQKMYQKKEEKKVQQNQEISKPSYNYKVNKPPLQNKEQKIIEEMKKNLPMNKIPSPHKVISIHHQKDVKDHKYLKPQVNQQQKPTINKDNQSQNQGIIKKAQVNCSTPQQQQKINQSRPQSEKRMLYQNKVQQQSPQIQKATEQKNESKAQQKPVINEKPMANYQRIKSAQYQRQKNFENKIIYNNNIQQQKKPEFQVWQKQLGQKQIIAQNALELKKK